MTTVPLTRLKLIVYWFVVIAMASLAAMALLTVADVAGRYLFRAPVRGAYELVSLLGGVSLSFTLPYLQSTSGHIKMDLLQQMFAPWAQKGSNVAFLLLSVAVLGLLSWKMIGASVDLSGSRQQSETLGIPLWTFYLIMALGPACATLIALDQLLQLFAGKNDDSV